LKQVAKPQIVAVRVCARGRIDRVAGVRLRRGIRIQG
jgi:hypothetical protein